MAIRNWNMFLNFILKFALALILTNAACFMTTHLQKQNKIQVANMFDSVV